MKKRTLITSFILSNLGMLNVALADISIPMNFVNEKGITDSIGNVIVSESAYGLVFSPNLKTLPAGLHGFHVHENGSCEPKEISGKSVPAGSAGGHLDPHQTKKHGLPWSKDAHLGDLPALSVTADGISINPVLAPRLKMDDIKGRALMIHIGGDNHSDHPAPLGGGGGRMACGVIGK